MLNEVGGGAVLESILHVEDKINETIDLQYFFKYTRKY